MFWGRKKTDSFFRRLFTLVSFSSVLALSSILIFIFVQGIVPFVSSTAPGIRLVVEGIDEITVNGAVYKNQTTFIEIPPKTAVVSLSFINRGKEEALEFRVNENEKDPAKQLVFTGGEGGEVEISSSEAYLYTAQYPGLPGMRPKVHIILPEPPYSLGRFLAGLDWLPTYQKSYGIFPMILGTILAALGAVILGLPLGILAALFMAEFLGDKAAPLVRAGVELLAGIPSVVYGFFGLMVIVPWVKNSFGAAFGAASGNSLLSAVIVLSLMILPTVIAIAETSLRAVPRSHREASLALGASKMQTAWGVVLPHARSGVIAGIILGISRAAGETMAVILVAGNSAQIIKSPLDSVRTLTATIALEMGYSSGRHSQMLFSIGITLFVMILLLNGAILWIRRRAEGSE